MLLRSNMKFRRAVGCAFLAYVLTMIVGIITMAAAGLEMTSMANPPLWLCIVSSIGAALLCWFVAWLYFRGKNIQRGAKYGFYLGIYMVIVGFILDVVMWTVSFPGGTTMEGMQQLLKYYTMRYFWLTFILIFIATTLTGKHMKRD